MAMLLPSNGRGAGESNVHGTESFNGRYSVLRSADRSRMLLISCPVRSFKEMNERGGVVKEVGVVEKRRKTSLPHDCNIYWQEPIQSIQKIEYKGAVRVRCLKFKTFAEW